MFYKLSVLENYAGLIGKNLCWSFFLIKLQTRRPEGLQVIKKRLLHRFFLMNIANCLRTPFLIEHLLWLLRKTKLMFTKTGRLILLKHGFRSNCPEKFDFNHKVKACVRYFLSNFYFFMKWWVFKNYEKCFLFHLKSSFLIRFFLLKISNKMCY